jgi:hypothetical protein
VDQCLILTIRPEGSDVSFPAYKSTVQLTSGRVEMKSQCSFFGLASSGKRDQF